jgi:hypothetical protein
MILPREPLASADEPIEVRTAEKFSNRIDRSLIALLR